MVVGCKNLLGCPHDALDIPLSYLEIFKPGSFVSHPLWLEGLKTNFVAPVGI